MFSLMFEDLLQKGANFGNEDVLYNHTNVSSMSKYKNGRPLWVTKVIHHVILQALIEVCFQLISLVVNFFVFTSSLRFLSFSSFLAFIPILFLTFMLQLGNNIKVC